MSIGLPDLLQYYRAAQLSRVVLVHTNPCEAVDLARALKQVNPLLLANE